MAEKPFIHPYIPNSAPATKAAMLAELGLSSVEEIYAEIPDRLRFRGRLDIPEPILAERDLRRHVLGLLDKNRSAVDFLNFCGAGCWQHHVPSVVDEIINRAEFVSAYCGGDYSDLGKYLTRFEFNSMLGELLDYDAVANPIYDWGDVAGRSFRMARRITGRDKVLVPAHVSPMRL
ncbi:MAG TPA: aminomethyl-transferring glycine dehydrogenase, partial [Thermoleophilia bacterium]|nr:aminomethyl-transferring glycine dehydrogenase [Thermoleophilia bacterium]